MIAALFAFVLPGPPNIEAVTLSLVFTFQGAICFFIGSYLMLPEAVFQPES
jgi:threonine/homoserine/homoserine lactone efflux protein